MQFGCVEPYSPPAIEELIDLMVVDGFIDASSNTADVRLSRATPLSETGAGAPEQFADVAIEDDDGNSFPLAEVEPGKYVMSNGDFSFSKKYRVVIVSQNSKNYHSDFIQLARTPAIDSVNWKPGFQHRGIDIHVNTHDDLNQTHYYQWTFEETW